MSARQATHSAGSDNVPRRRIQEALQMFSELQQLSMADLTATDRIINAPPSAAAAPSQRVSSSYSTSSGHGVGSGSTSARVGPAAASDDVQALKHKMDVADAITRRLHKKNQELVAQLEQIKTEQRRGSGGVLAAAATAVSARPLDSPLKREIEHKDREIRALKEMLASSNTPPPHASRVSAAAAAGGDARLGSAFRDARTAKLQQQYDDLLRVKLECIAEGESTGKVNKEVKAFFTALKQKILSDAVFAEVERAATSELLFELEQRVASAGA
jgi:hypothetical protein